jgi:hypothetical protein
MVVVLNSCENANDIDDNPRQMSAFVAAQAETFSGKLFEQIPNVVGVSLKGSLDERSAGNGLSLMTKKLADVIVGPSVAQVL